MKRQSGITLVELMITIAIAAIMLTMAVASYGYIANSYRMSGEVNSLLGDMQYARAEALKEGQNVTVCVSLDGLNCTNTTAWQSGWLVYSNPTNVTNPLAGTVLRVQQPFTGMTPDTFVASNAVSAITYNREGFATTAAGFPNTTITLHDKTANPNWTRCLWITPVGLLQTETPAKNASGTCS
jgi:type IV fimbrial biogenesis protein FimT